MYLEDGSEIEECHIWFIVVVYLRGGGGGGGRDRVGKRGEGGRERG